MKATRLTVREAWATADDRRGKKRNGPPPTTHYDEAHQVNNFGDVILIGPKIMSQNGINV